MEHSRQGNHIRQGCRQQGRRKERMVIPGRPRRGRLEPDKEGLAGLVGSFVFLPLCWPQCGQKHSPVLLCCWGQEPGAGQEGWLNRYILPRV